MCNIQELAAEIGSQISESQPHKHSLYWFVSLLFRNSFSTIFETEGFVLFFTQRFTKQFLKKHFFASGKILKEFSRDFQPLLKHSTRMIYGCKISFYSKKNFQKNAYFIYLQ